MLAMKRLFFIMCCLAGMGVLKSSAGQTPDSAGLSVQVLMPQFLYEGDRFEVPVIITNRGADERTGQLQLLLADAETATSVDGWFQNVFPVQYFTVASGISDTLRFPVEIPYLFRKRFRWRLAIGEGILDEGILPVHFFNSVAAKNPAALRLTKRIFRRPPGQASFVPVNAGMPIRLGDSLKIQLLVWSGRDIRQAQLTDALTAAFTPILSSIADLKKASFQPTTDSSGVTLSRALLLKGRTLFEYTIVATHAGLFHSGAATIQGTGSSKIAAHTAPLEIRIEDGGMGF